MNEIRIAKRYARVALSNAIEKSLIDTFYKDFVLVQNSIKGSRELGLLLKNPVTNKDKKISIVKELFGKHINNESFEFIRFLIDKGRDNIILEILNSFFEIRNEYLGLLEVNVFGFYPLSEDQQGKIKKELEETIKKKITVSFQVDKSILGGIIIKIDDTVLDASVKRKLELLKEHMLKAN
jgi:F-type H+-transporting ATPase subunit delta